MANCENRVNTNQAGENAANNIKYSVSRKPEHRKPQGAIVASREPVALCQVKLNQISHYPVCELPDTSTEDCPIAQFARGEIDMEATNAKLRQLYGQA